MPEPLDAIMPVLQRIDADLADVKRTSSKHSDMLEAIQKFLFISMA
jgi:hypothetical protein